MQTYPAVEQNKNIKWSESPWNQSGRKGKGLLRKLFAEEPSLKFRVKDWTSKRRCKWWSWRWWRGWWWWRLSTYGSWPSSGVVSVSQSSWMLHVYNDWRLPMSRVARGPVMRLRIETTMERWNADLTVVRHCCCRWYSAVVHDAQWRPRYRRRRLADSTWQRDVITTVDRVGSGGRNSRRLRAEWR